LPDRLATLDAMPVQHRILPLTSRPKLLISFAASLLIA
jgi:hypothetical protein